MEVERAAQGGDSQVGLMVVVAERGPWWQLLVLLTGDKGTTEWISGKEMGRCSGSCCSCCWLARREWWGSAKAEGLRAT